MTHRYRLLVIALLLTGLLMPMSADTPRVRALFIGNSLTYENNLPAMIEAIAAQAGLRDRVVCRAIALPNFGLQEHWEKGDAVRAIRNGTWTHIVLQQGPSSLDDSRTVLREYAKKFSFEAKMKGAKVVLYAVWPSRNRLTFQDAVTESYRLAAQDVDGILVAAGEGWRAAWRDDPSLPLYAADQFHPSPMGTYLAALMLFQAFTGQSPVGLPTPDGSQKGFQGLTITPAQLAILQRAAAQANGTKR